METEVNGSLWRILEAFPVNEWFKVNYRAEALCIIIIKVLSVVSIVAYQDYQDHEEEIVFSHTWDWVRMRTIIIVQDVQVHGWLLE